MKRGRKDQLTGGSGDVNPQEIVFPLLTQTGADAARQVAIQLPIPRLPTSPGRNLVIEVLWVDFYFNIEGAAVGFNRFSASITTNPNAQTTVLGLLQDVRNIAQVYRVFVFAAGGTSTMPDQETVDTTDEAGHGELVATDTLYANLVTSGTNATNNMVCRMGYRWKDVSLVEYIGIVQSQQ